LVEDYDKAQDAKSESRYESDPRAEPDTTEIKERPEPVFVCFVDESAGFRG
jgi:hypothetical protein